VGPGARIGIPHNALPRNGNGSRGPIPALHRRVRFHRHSIVVEQAGIPPTRYFFEPASQAAMAAITATAIGTITYRQ
jgi:hypothetical protein